MQIPAFSYATPRSAAGHPSGCPCCQPATGPNEEGTASLRDRLDALAVKPEEITHVIYHDPCFDGFGAAWSAHQRLGDKAKYIGVNYGDKPPELPKDARVAIVDFSFPRAELEEMKGKVAGLVVLDHHKTAEENLKGLPYAVFEKERAGAGIAWEYFHPDKPVPLLVSLVEDRDLWRFELPQSREFSAALASYPREFGLWSTMDIDHLKVEGTAILRYKNQLVEANMERVRMGNIRGYEVPIVNVTAEVRSEVGDALCKKYPDAPFVGLYFEDKEGDRKWSLRSRSDFDVTTVLKTFKGGGGHPQAGGFEQPRTDLSEEWLVSSPVYTGPRE